MPALSYPILGPYEWSVGPGRGLPGAVALQQRSTVQGMGSTLALSLADAKQLTNTLLFIVQSGVGALLRTPFCVGDGWRLNNVRMHAGT